MDKAQGAAGIPPFEVLIYEVQGPVCTLTMNRPARRNALSAQLVNELIVALETAGADPSVRVVILTGAGGAFCSGGDLSQMQAGSGETGGSVPFRGGFVELNLAFEALRKPVIAKVRRYAYAGGLGLVCACTFALAEEGAKFGTPEIDRGIFPMMIMANIFRCVPRRQGLEMILTGERIDAARAVSMGLLNRCVPADRLDEEVAALARTLAAKPPAVLRLGLEAFYAQDGLRTEQALPYLQQKLLECFATEDAREGLAAFFEKRPPAWALESS